MTHDALYDSPITILDSRIPVKPVWIIDDDRSIRWVFEKALTRENIAFKTFSSADEALVMLASESPQIVVSDIRMPGTSGIDAKSLMTSLDTDGNGSVSSSELKENAHTLFDQLRNQLMGSKADSASSQPDISRMFSSFEVPSRTRDQ